MKKALVLATVMMLSLTTGVSQACEGTPIIMASAAYTFSDRPALPSSNAFVDTNSTNNGIEFVHVTGGCYCMGEAAGTGAHEAAQVCVDDYYMGKFEVTQAQWREIMGNNPSTLSGCGDNCPVVDISWNEVQEFTRRLNERTGKTYRLPTEAEWEFAIRAGGIQANNAASSGGADKLRPVGLSQPNGLGIYDMLGSVWEWTGDNYSRDYYKHSPQYNPEGPSGGLYRVLRGGSWDDARQSIHPSMRASYEPWLKRPWVGFRLTSSDQYSAKYRNPEMLAKEIAGRDLQCGPGQQASNQATKSKLTLSQSSQK